jgi:hypothetical protein
MALRHKQSFLLACLLFCAAARFASGQMIPPMSPNLLYYVPSANMSMQMHVITAEAMKSQAITRSNQSTRPAASTEVRAVAFQRKPDISEKVIRALVQGVEQRDPANAKRFETDIRSAKFVDAFDKILAHYGYSGVNLVDVVTGYWIIGWEVVTGKEATPTQIRAVNRQLGGALPRIDAFSRMKNEEKQTMAEVMAFVSIMSVSASNLYKQKGDQTQLAAVREQVSATLKQFGFDPRAYRLTDQGFAKIS